mgnify:CR=1 FL=1
MSDTLTPEVLVVLRRRLEIFDSTGVSVPVEPSRLAALLAAAERCARLEAAHRALLNKVNVVTAYHRHGQRVSRKMLDDLSNRQVEVEEALRGAK